MAHHNGVLFLRANYGSLKCFEKGSGDLIMGKRIFGIMEKGIMMRKQEGTVKYMNPARFPKKRGIHPMQPYTVYHRPSKKASRNIGCRAEFTSQIHRQSSARVEKESKNSSD